MLKGTGFRLVRLASWRTLLVMALTMGVLGMQSGRGTLAYFTDSVASSGNILSAGNLRLTLNSANPTGTITFNASTIKLKPGAGPIYSYVALANDGGALNGAVPATVTTFIKRFGNSDTASTCAPAAGEAAACLDGRLNFEVKSFAADPTNSAGCQTNWASGTDVTLAAPLATAPTNGTSRTPIAHNTNTQNFFASTVSFVGGATETKYYCWRFTWVDGTPDVDNPAKQGDSTYTLTFNGQST
jgi:predicted ribosomally synthesized peptide with SipW-like signal peptide